MSAINSSLTSRITAKHRKKNAHRLTIIREALSFVNDEISIVRMDLEHPDRFLEFSENDSPLALWAGNVIEIVEYSLGPQAAGRLLKPSGQPMSYADSIKLIERVFGLSIPDLYDRRATALSRTKNTVFQDEMRRVYLEEAKKTYK